MTPAYWTALAIIIAVNVLYVVFGIARHKRNMRDSVFANLDAAKASGHFERGGWLYTYNADGIAKYLALYETGLDGEHCASDIMPYVREWIDTNQDAG